MADTFVSITGNLTDDPELRFTQSGATVANFRVAVTARVPDGKGGWQEGETGFYRVTA
jgi:single-strand DNA-binding protein